MITIKLGDGLAIYTLLILGIVLVLGVYESWRDRLHAWRISEPQLGECTSCGLTFLVRRHDNVIRCPRCSAFCSMRKR
jgi:hypothetical protein